MVGGEGNGADETRQERPAGPTSPEIGHDFGQAPATRVSDPKVPRRQSHNPESVDLLSSAFQMVTPDMGGNLEWIQPVCLSPCCRARGRRRTSSSRRDLFNPRGSGSGNEDDGHERRLTLFGL